MVPSYTFPESPDKGVEDRRNSLMGMVMGRKAGGMA